MNELDKGEEPQLPRNAALEAIQQALGWAYTQAVNIDIPGVPGATKLAQDYLTAAGGDVERAIGNLITWQVTNAAIAGFATNLGGVITLPIAIPANLASVLFLQLRMVGAIAYLRGYDIKSEQVRGLAIACLVGSSVTDLLGEVGITVGTKMAQQAINRIPGAVLMSINKAVGFRLITKAGQTGAVNLSRLVPFVGGLIGGTVDAFVTLGIGEAAKLVFTPVEPTAREPETA